MIFISCIILGTIGSILSILYAYEWSGADPYIYVFIIAYTISIATLNFGLNNTRHCMRSDK